MNKRAVGSFYEDVAVDYLKSKGVKILQRNFRCKFGELDIVGKDGECVVIVEVKYRASDSFGEALYAVGAKKQRRICKCAIVYCMLHPEVKELRYDVLAISDTKVDWIQNAFMHIGYSIY